MPITQAMNYLTKDTLRNIDMIESIRRGQAEIIAASQDGVLLRDTLGNTHMLSADSRKAAKALLGPSRSMELMVAHQDFTIGLLEEEYGMAKELLYYQVAYLDAHMPTMPSSPASFAWMEEADADFVHRHYSHGAEISYVQKRLAAKAILGAYVDGERAGFIGTHPEGSIGMLEVLPDFRRMGIAQALETQMICRMLERGHTPFAQIVTDNLPSMNLQLKLGYTACADAICWMHRQSGYIMA